MSVVYVNGVPNVSDFATSKTNPPVVVDRLSGDVYCLKAGTPYKTGSVGGEGTPGPQGAEGPEGPQGPKGDQGVKGDTGEAGPEGPQGVPGNDGAQGPQGDPGVKGDTGDTGPEGPEGPQGEAGSGGSPLDAWPVGSVYIAVDNTSPATRFGGGTWAAFATGRMLVGFNGADADFDVAEETGGAKTVTLTAAQSGLPQHTHLQNAHTHDFLPRSGTSGGVSSIVTGTLDTSSAIGGANQAHVQNATAVNQNAGPADAAQAHNNLPPYITVFMWKRTA